MEYEIIYTNRAVKDLARLDSAATVVTALLSDPGSYGRVIRDGYLGIKKIVESKDAKKEYYLTELARVLAMLLPNSSAAPGPFAVMILSAISTAFPV